MKKVYKYMVCAVLAVMLAFVCVGCGSGDDSKVTADYSSPAEAIKALKNGGHIIGKTVKVKATETASGGMIYHAVDSSLDADVYVSLTEVKSDTIKKGKTIAVKIDSVDRQSDQCYYIFGAEQ